METFALHFDGSCGPKNPGGTAAYGFALSRKGQVIHQGNDVIGTGDGMTNNLAEFHGLAAGLKAALLRTKRGDLLEIKGDSQLVIKIMNKVWRPSKDKAYYPGYAHALVALRQLRMNGVAVTFGWVPREKNQDCDDLSKAHLKVPTGNPQNI